MNSTMNPYEVLGIKKDADIEEIKKKFKEKVKNFHPDTGGSTEEFIKFKKAYDILINPIKRQIYDSTGRVDDEMINSDEELVKSVIEKMFKEMIDAFIEIEVDEREYLSLIKQMFYDVKERIRENIKELNKENSFINESIKKLENVKSNIKYIGEDNLNFFHKTIDSKLEELRAINKKNVEILGLLKSTLQIIKSYKIRSYNG